MMNTLRTDAALDAVANLKTDWIVPPIFIDSHRQLERELAAEKEKVKQLRQQITNSVSLAGAYGGISRNNFENLLSEFVAEALDTMEKTK